MRFDEPILAPTRSPGGPDGALPFDPRPYWQLLVRRWPWIAGAILLGIAIGVGKYTISPKLYRASTRIQIEPRSIVSVSTDRNPWLDQWTNMKYFPTQYRLLRSRGLAETVIDELGLDSEGAFAPAASPAKADAGYSAAEDEHYRASLANRILSNLRVDPIEGTELLDIHYIGTDPELVQRITNGFADAFIDFGINKRRETLVQARKILHNQIELLRSEVEDLELEIKDLGQRDEGGIDPSLDSADQALLRLNEQATTAMSNALARQQRYRDLQGTPDEVIAANSSRASIVRLESDMLAYERDYETGLQTFKPDHPSMAELRSRLDETQRRYDEAVSTEAKAARRAAYSEWQAALRLIDVLDRQREETQQENLSLSVDSLPLANLQMEVAAKRQRLAELVERQSQAELTTGEEADEDTRSNVHVIDRALLPRSPFRPSLRQNVTLGGGVGLMLGIGVVLLFYFLDRTIKSPDDVQRFLALPVLAVIPDVGNDGGSYGYRANYGMRKKAERSKPRKQRPRSIELLPASEPRLAVSEAYRSLRTALILSSAEDLEVVTVTSAEAGEGKTATSTNLATVMAQLGKRVLLVDGDLRKPRLHKVFEAPNQQGLVNCLTTGEHPDSLVQKTSVPGLGLLTAGPHPPNPSELLASERMRKFVAWARAQFDLVVIDSPPTLAVSDAILSGSVSDGVILCIASGRTTREPARNCAEQLEVSGVKLLGVVLNRHDPRNSNYYDRRYKYYEAYAEYEADSAA